MQYQELVRQVDCETISPKQLAIRLFGNSQWHNLFAAASAYCEHGGTKFTYQEFIDAINPRFVLIPVEKPIAPRERL